jgi:hypothetical protein
MVRYTHLCQVARCSTDVTIYICELLHSGAKNIQDLIAIPDSSEAVHKVEESVACLTETFEMLKQEVCRNPSLRWVLAALSRTLSAGELPGLQSRLAASNCVENKRARKASAPFEECRQQYERRCQHQCASWGHIATSCDRPRAVGVWSRRFS